MTELADNLQRHRPPREGSKRAAGAGPHLHWLAERQQMFRGVFDFGSGAGLEIGPLDTPAVDRSISDVSYLDVYDRAGIVEKYRDDDNVLLELIPETTFPLSDGDRIRSLAEAAVAGAPFDWVVASHVVEHIPNLVGWLADIAEITSPAGALVLAVPDRRFMFDCHRPPTSTGAVVEAYLRGDTRPSPRAVYDGVATHVPADVSGLTSGARPLGRSARSNSPLVALEAARQAEHEYVDVHVWTFSAREFVELIVELRELGLSDWYVEKLAADEHAPSFEFLVVLRKAAPGVTPLAEVRPDSELPAWLAEQWRLRDTAQQLSNRLGEALELMNRLADVVSKQQPQT